MNFLCQLSNTLINCCSQLSAVVQMSLITIAPIGPTPSFFFSPPLAVSWSPLPLPPSQLVFPAALALQGTRCHRSRNCVLMMLHCFLDRLQPSGSMILNLHDRWQAKRAQSKKKFCHTDVRLSLMKQPQSNTTNVISAVGLITVGAVNCAAGLNASHNAASVHGRWARWWKRGSSQLQSNLVRVPSCSSPELRLETCSENIQITVWNMWWEKCWTVPGLTIEGRQGKLCVWEYLCENICEMHIGVACENLLRHQPECSSKGRQDDRCVGI